MNKLNEKYNKSVVKVDILQKDYLFIDVDPETKFTKNSKWIY